MPQALSLNPKVGKPAPETMSRMLHPFSISPQFFLVMTPLGKYVRPDFAGSSLMPGFFFFLFVSRSDRTFSLRNKVT